MQNGLNFARKLVAKHILTTGDLDIVSSYKSVQLVAAALVVV